MIVFSDISISSCGTFHLHNGESLYPNRFLSVLKFSSYGLAAVKDHSGAYHINLQGVPIYHQRYDKTYGFYHERAAVVVGHSAFHIKTDGMPAYGNTFLWVGNFQDNCCVVKDTSGFYHIDQDGYPLYPERYDYVGDFKDGIAVVYLPKGATHIDKRGYYLHDKWFKQLDIYHKGFARAEDEVGWFHIDKLGHALYAQRYKEVEPFYNDLAKVKSSDGSLLQIDLSHQIVTTISPVNTPKFDLEVSDDLVGFWKTFVIHAGVQLKIFDHLPAAQTDLAEKIAIPIDNLIRLLRALWEMKLISFDLHEHLWRATEKGGLLQRKKNTFLPSAAVLWANVASQNWLHLADKLKGKIQTHRSFKDQEIDESVCTDYFAALTGYALNDVAHLFSDILTFPQKWIGFGRSSLGIIQHIATSSVQHDVSIFVGSHIPQLYALESHITVIENLTEAKVGYDIGILLRFLHYFNDELVIAYLEQIHQLKVKKLLIFETIINANSPEGGLLDINMLMETGGRLRTLEQWQKLIAQSHYTWTTTTVMNPYLSLLELVAINASFS